MKRSLKHAYENSPFYRQRFTRPGVHPEDLKTLADLAKFPFTYKQDLRDNYPFGMFAVPREQAGAGPCLVGHDGQAHGGGLYQGRHRQSGPT
jgi:phenylacetate-coenzyme A ligase PaaK-like adenylate-forming protein